MNDTVTTIALEITYDPTEVGDPRTWAWPELLDTPCVEHVKVLDLLGVTNDVLTVPLDFDTAEAFGFDGTMRSGPSYVTGTEPVRINLPDGRVFVGVEVPPSAFDTGSDPFEGLDDAEPTDRYGNAR